MALFFKRAFIFCDCCLTVFNCHLDELLNGEVPHGANVVLEVPLPQPVVGRVRGGLEVVGQEPGGKQDQAIVGPARTKHNA